MKKFYDYVFQSDYQGAVLSVNDKDYTLTDLALIVERYEQILSRHGSLLGKKVGILVPHIPQYLAIFFAVNKLGGILVPLSYQYRQQDLTSILELTEPHIVFTVEYYNGISFGSMIRDWVAKTNQQRLVFSQSTGDYYDEVLEVGGVEIPLETEQIHLIGCTSGSTGTPKGVTYTEDGLLHWCNNLKSVVGLKPGDRLFQTVPSTSLFGIFWYLSGIHNHVQTICSEVFDVFKLVDLFAKYDCNKVSSTPSAFRAIYTFGQGLRPGLFKNLELCIIAGEIISPELVSLLSETIRGKIISTYGLSEQGLIMVTSTDLRDGIMWRMVPGIGYRLQDMNSEGVGEIAFHTPEGAFSGYYKRPDLTAEVVTEDGWYSTGDLAEIDESDTIRLLGRKKDMIKKGAISIVPGEIEYYLEQHPNVKQAVVVGNAHKVYGEEIVAFILPDGELNIGELRQFCVGKIAGYKIPDQFYIVDTIPLTQGKVDKVYFRNLLAN